MLEISRILSALTAAPDQPAALTTLVQVTGSSYRRPGARLLLFEGGARLGSISGGCLEDDVVLRARRVLETGCAECVTYDTTSENDLVWGVGLGCGGTVRLLIEPVPVKRPSWLRVLAENLRARRDTALRVVHRGGFPLGTELNQGAAPEAAGMVFREIISAPPSLAVFGAGDDTQPLVRMAKETGWHVTVADTRSAYANELRFPEADAVIAAPLGHIAQSLPEDGRSFVVIMTHRYADDLELLRSLLPRSLPYLGLLGARKRTDRLLAQLEDEGFRPTQEMLNGLHAPVGLDLGGDVPETVALAILAEVQGRLAGRLPINLRDRTAPIHG